MFGFMHALPLLAICSVPVHLFSTSFATFCIYMFARSASFCKGFEANTQKRLDCLSLEFVEQASKRLARGVVSLAVRDVFICPACPCPTTVQPYRGSVNQSTAYSHHGNECLFCSPLRTRLDRHCQISGGIILII